MLDTQSRSMQCVNGFSESVGNGDVFLDKQISDTDRPVSIQRSAQPFHTASVPTRAEGQAKSKDLSRPVQGYIEVRSKRCSEVYKVEKLYVGLLRELPPPSAVQDKWDREVRPDLERHLCQATSMLSKSMRDEEIITELVLCMAGKKCSPASVVLEPGATCPKEPIALKPTVWIHCGSKKCKKKVLGTIRNLTYLNHFLDRFCMEPPYASLHAPWPAAGEHPPHAHLEENVHKISFAVQCPASGWTTICGAKARFTIQTPDSTIERYSTLGGVIIVENSLFGLTSAHAVVNYFLEGSRNASTDEIELTDNSSSDSGSDCETSSDSSSETYTGSPRSSHARTTPTGRPSVEANWVHEMEGGIWVELQLPKVLAYTGRGTTSGDYSFPNLAPNTSDFALIDLGSLRTLPNGFHDPDHETVLDISSYIPTCSLFSGEVWILATCGDIPLKGYLLEGDASVILRGTVMHTKKIQVACAGAPGLSGSWVVREGKLCGSIYAAYDRSPYLHMLPAERIFQDIAELLLTSNVRVATPLDIRQRGSLTRRAGTNNEGAILPSPQRLNMAVPADGPENINKGLWPARPSDNIGERKIDNGKQVSSAGELDVVPPKGKLSIGIAEGRGLPSDNIDERKIDKGKQVSSAGESDAILPKGKLWVGITEGRGLRPSMNPYVVCQFQRAEYISDGPKHESSEDTRLSGLAMRRTENDKGRPRPIPMGSRQSSNSGTSSDPSSNPSSNTSSYPSSNSREFKNPKWEHGAVFDVVGDHSEINVSVYDRSNQEAFLGHVRFCPDLIGYEKPLDGWFPLEPREGEEISDDITGEIHLRISFHKTERKHVGPEDFQILTLIGKGTFGQVFQVRKKDTRRIYAMKVLSKEFIVQKKEVAHTMGERNILVRTATLGSPFIVGLKFSFQTPTDLYLVTDYMSGGELFWHLQREGRFLEHRAKFYIAELILALQHLHEHDIVYRSLKPENILLDAEGHVALCDFGLSKANLTGKATTDTFCGDTEYLAPEVLLGEHGYTKMVDFWSLGVLVFEMCCGWSPFYSEDTQQTYKNIAFGKVRCPRDALSSEGRSFVKGLLNRNPNHRLGSQRDAEELKEHPFFADIDWDALAKKNVPPPFKPKLKSEEDVSNFDPEFTHALNIGVGSLNARAAALASGINLSSTPLSPTLQNQFKGFTFVDDSVMEKHFKGQDDHERIDEDDRDDAD